MSEVDQQPEKEESYGGRMAGMFGFVTPDDRNRWKQQRESEKATKNKGKKGAGEAVNRMYKTLDRKHNAMERVVSQADFEQENVKATQMKFDESTQRLEEVVEWTPVSEREREGLDSDFDIEAGPEL